MAMLARTPSSFENSEKSPASAAAINFSQTSGSLASEHSPDGEHAVSVEMVVGDKLYAFGQLLAVGRCDQIQSNLGRSVRFNFRWRMIPLPVREVDAVLNRAVNRKLRHVFQSGVVILKSHLYTC